MTLISKVILMHDRLLARSLARQPRRMGPFLFLSGIIALWTGWLIDDAAGKILLAAGGFSVGLAVEKFAQFQVQRIKKNPRER